MNPVPRLALSRRSLWSTVLSDGRESLLCPLGNSVPATTRCAERDQRQLASSGPAAREPHPSLLSSLARLPSLRGSLRIVVRCSLHASQPESLAMRSACCWRNLSAASARRWGRGPRPSRPQRPERPERFAASGTTRQRRRERNDQQAQRLDLPSLDARSAAREREARSMVWPVCVMTWNPPAARLLERCLA